MNFWIQMSRLMLKGGRRGWHCNDYLDGTHSDPHEPYPSGGRNSTKSPQSMAFIRQIRPGDLVVLYQVDDEAIHAISQAQSPGLEADRGSRKFNLFYLMPAVTAFRPRPPLTLAQLREAGCDPKCLGPGNVGRIFPLETEDILGIIKALTQVNPDQSAELAAWVQARSGGSPPES